MINALIVGNGERIIEVLFFYHRAGFFRRSYF